MKATILELSAQFADSLTIWEPLFHIQAESPDLFYTDGAWPWTILQILILSDYGFLLTCWFSWLFPSLLEGIFRFRGKCPTTGEKQKSDPNGKLGPWQKDNGSSYRQEMLSALASFTSNCRRGSDSWRGILSYLQKFAGLAASGIHSEEEPSF